MSNTQVTMPLEGALEGYSIVVDTDNITLGFYEDLESDMTKDRLNALSEVIVGGSLPHGTDRTGLRKLKPVEFNALCGGIAKALQVPKNA